MGIKWLWLGCSNERPFSESFKSESRHFELCTRLEHFETQLESLTEEIIKELSGITITGLDNVFADLELKHKSMEKIESGIDEFFGKIEEIRKQGVKTICGPLLMWKKHSKELRSTAAGAIKTMKTTYPGIRMISKLKSLKFIADGVHLNDRSAKVHFAAVQSASEQFFFHDDDEYNTEDETVMEVMDTDNEIEITKVVESEINIVGTGGPENDQEAEDDSNEDQRQHSIHNVAFKALITEVRNIKNQMMERWQIDLIVSAGTKEDLDRIENSTNMNKIIISGLEVHNIWAAEDWKARVPLIKKEITAFFKLIDPGFTKEPGYIKHLNGKLKGARQIIEVTMESEAEGKKMRKIYADRIREWREAKSFPAQVHGLSMAPALTLATRVRVAILHALAKSIKKNYPYKDLWVIQHVARPVIKIESTQEEVKFINSFGFAQALTHMFKELPRVKLSSQDLFDAYNIAGTRFGDEIGHYFVIMNKKEAQRIAQFKRTKKK